MPATKQSVSALPSLRVDVLESEARSRAASRHCVIDRHLKFSTESLESYFFASWEPAVYDALLVAAAVEYCDRVQRRPALDWGREFDLSIPVHDPDRWNQKTVLSTLHETLDFLTGDRWRITFYARKRPLAPPQQGHFQLKGKVRAVIPFSDGLDSRAVAGLQAQRLGDALIRIRLGHRSPRSKEPFTAVPYRVVNSKRDSPETSQRSRGFKFALIAGIAAYFADAEEIIVPESGQGALGPALLSVGQAYEDYRSHPLFTRRMEAFLAALLGFQVSFRFPQLWQTKGETLSRFVKECGDGASWQQTWSCWQQARQASVGNRKRQCGICAACMLRRLSVHAAGLTEPKETYVWEDLSAPTLEAGAADGFDGITRKMREYAIAGALHLDHLANIIHSRVHAETLSLNTLQLSQSCALPIAEARERLRRLLTQHETEWKDLLHSLGADSFVAQWAVRGR